MQKSFSMSISIEIEPETYEEASQQEYWNKAMIEELQALQRNKTWNIVQLHYGITPIGSIWVFKIKRKQDGSIDRYKARLVTKGYNQREGLNYYKTFVLVIKMKNVRVLLALLSINNWHLHQLGINNDFLHGDLDEEVYIEFPPGMNPKFPNKACKLIKYLYRLKMASRTWHDKLLTTLTKDGFVHASSDHSLFQHIKDILHKKFGIKDIGKLK